MQQRARRGASARAEHVLGSPLRNLAIALVFVVAVFIVATSGYVAAGWTLGDAVYMVTLKIFSVGYGEVHPIDTPFLHELTIGTIVLGCTVLPMHIGAERIAEMILYPTTAKFLDGSPQLKAMKRDLHEFGLELEGVTAVRDGVLTGATVTEAERRGQGAFFIVQIDRADGRTILHAADDERIEAGDNVVLVVRSRRVSAGAIFSAPRGRVRVGRTDF